MLVYPGMNSLTIRRLLVPDVDDFLEEGEKERFMFPERGSPGQRTDHAAIGIIEISGITRIVPDILR